MAKTVTSGFTSKNTLLAQPRYFTRFYWTGSAAASVASEYAFSMDFATGPVLTQTVSKYEWMGIPEGNTQSIIPEQGRSSVGQIALTLVDWPEDGTRGEVTKYLSNPRVALQSSMSTTSPASGGFVTAQASPSLNGYPVLGTLLIGSERIRYGGVNVSSQAFTSIVRAVDGTTVSSHTHGDAIHNGEEIRPGTRCQLYLGYADLTEADYAPWIKMEVFDRRDAGDEPAYEVVLADIQRLLDKVCFAHASEASPVVLTGNPITLALQAILTTPEGGNNSTYDLAKDGWGNVPQNLVDVSGLETLKASDFNTDVYDFKIVAPVRLKSWLEEQIWKTLNCYPVISASGQYTAVRYKPAPAPGSQSQIIQDDILGRLRWTGGDRLVINEVLFYLDWDLPENPGKFNTIYRFTSTESKLKYGRRDPLVVKSEGIKTASSGSAIALDRATKVFQRYADPPPVLEGGVMFNRGVLDAGDIVRVTDDQVRNQRSGLRGVSGHVMEIVDLTPRFPDGIMEMRLLHTGIIITPDAPLQETVTPLSVDEEEVIQVAKYGFEYVSATQVKVTRTGRNSAGTLAIVIDIGGTVREKTGSDLTIDITTDLESGQSEASSTWYYAYVRWDGSAILGQLSNTAPNAAGYHATQTNWRCVGSVRNDGSSNFRKFLRWAKHVEWDNYSGSALLSGGTATVFTDVDASAEVPATSPKLLAICIVKTTAATAGGGYVRQNGSTAAAGKQCGEVTNVSGSIDTVVQSIPLDASRIFEYKSDGADIQFSVRAQGYVEDLVA